MRCLTLTQPWATLVAIGVKRIETRSWSTSYRGPLLIHAAKGLGPVGGITGLDLLCHDEPFRSALGEYGPCGVRQPPLGAIVAVCRVCAMTKIERLVSMQYSGVMVHGRSVWVSRDVTHIISDQEYAFGDYSPGRYMWLLANIRTLPEPIPAKGALGLWEPDMPTQTAVTRQLAGIEV
jgi:activating signal cointegrator 1